MALSIATKKRVGALLRAGQNRSVSHTGSRIDDFLKKEGIFEEAQAQAVKEVVAWQLAQAVKKKKISNLGRGAEKPARRY